MLDCWPTTGCEIISRKNYERLFRGWRRLFRGNFKSSRTYRLVCGDINSPKVSIA